MHAKLYAKHQQQIFKVIHAFRRRRNLYAVDFNEMLSAANLGFFKARRFHDPARGKFSTILQQCVWQALANEYRPRPRIKTVAAPLEALPSKRCSRFERLLSEVSDDARDLIHEMTRVAVPNRRETRRVIITTLTDLGWAGQRIVETIREIKEALA